MGSWGSSEAKNKKVKTKTKTEAKYKKIRGSSGGYQLVIGDSLADGLADSWGCHFIARALKAQRMASLARRRLTNNLLIV